MLHEDEMVVFFLSGFIVFCIGINKHNLNSEPWLDENAFYLLHMKPSSYISGSFCDLL